MSLYFVSFMKKKNAIFIFVSSPLPLSFIISRLVCKQCFFFSPNKNVLLRSHNQHCQNSTAYKSPRNSLISSNSWSLRNWLFPMDRGMPWPRQSDVIPFVFRLTIMSEGPFVAARQTVRRRTAHRGLCACHGTYFLISVPRKQDINTNNLDRIPIPASIVEFSSTYPGPG